MPPLQRARPLLLLALLGLCLCLGQAKDEVSAPKETSVAVPSNVTVSTSLSPSPPCANLPLVSIALGMLAALLLHLG